MKRSRGRYERVGCSFPGMFTMLYLARPTRLRGVRALRRRCAWSSVVKVGLSSVGIQRYSFWYYYSGEKNCASS